MKLTVGTKPVFATAIVCIRCGRRETHPLDRQNRNVALMVRELEDEVETLKAELNETQRHREGNQVCYVSEMCELERVKVKAAERCANCENLIITNTDQLFAYCPEAKIAFRPLDLDTRTVWCEAHRRGPEPKEGSAHEQNVPGEVGT